MLLRREHKAVSASLLQKTRWRSHAQSYIDDLRPLAKVIRRSRREHSFLTNHIIMKGGQELQRRWAKQRRALTVQEPTRTLSSLPTHRTKGRFASISSTPSSEACSRVIISLATTPIFGLVSALNDSNALGTRTVQRSFHDLRPNAPVVCCRRGHT